MALWWQRGGGTSSGGAVEGLTLRSQKGPDSLLAKATCDPPTQRQPTPVIAEYDRNILKSMPVKGFQYYSKISRQC